MSFYASTREEYQSRSIRFEATPFFSGSMPEVLAAASSNPSKQKVLLFPITTSTFYLIMCCWRLMKVVLQCQNQDALRSALWEPTTSQNWAGSKPPKRAHSVFSPNSAEVRFSAFGNVCSRQSRSPRSTRQVKASQAPARAPATYWRISTMDLAAPADGESLMEGGSDAAVQGMRLEAIALRSSHRHCRAGKANSDSNSGSSRRSCSRAHVRNQYLFSCHWQSLSLCYRVVVYE